MSFFWITRNKMKKKNRKILIPFYHLLQGDNSLRMRNKDVTYESIL